MSREYADGSKIQGLGLISAIFLITVVALLTIAITRTVATSADAYAMELQAARAFLVAESGAQLGVRALYPVTGVGTCSAQALDFSTAGYPGCQATVSCAATNVSGETYYQIDSSGRCTGGSEHVAERAVRVMTR